LKILTTVSLDKLKVHLSTHPLDVRKDFDGLVSLLDLKFVELDIPVTIEKSKKLLGSNNMAVSEEIPNVEIIWNTIGKISPLLALDERLWVTLTLTHHQEYLLSRWFDKSVDSKSVLNMIDTHLFATTSRKFIRDQALSRLWWAAKIASDLPGIDTNQALETMFWNSDLLSQITTRPGTAASRQLSSEILQLMYERKVNYKEFARDPFRDFMKEIDLTLGRNVVFSLPAALMKKRVAGIAKRTLG
jgi:hypothetical protein